VKTPVKKDASQYQVLILGLIVCSLSDMLGECIDPAQCTAIMAVIGAPQERIEMATMLAIGGEIVIQTVQYAMVTARLSARPTVGIPVSSPSSTMELSTMNAQGKITRVIIGVLHKWMNKD